MLAATGQNQIALDPLDITRATIVVRAGDLPAAEKAAGQVLREELQRRTGIAPELTTSWPQRGTTIALSSSRSVPGWRLTPPQPSAAGAPEVRPEGFRLTITRQAEQTIVWVLGADGRGTLFGAGELLRALSWGTGRATIPGDLEVATAPRYAIRGHQLGYRQQANSYDGWDDRQFDQYIRELALFGNNSVEGIPHQDSRPSPVFTLPRAVMNRRISESCARYDLDYWLWMPAEFDLKDQPRRAQELQKVDALFRDLPRLDAIFFPGGDPGNNPPDLVIPYLRDMATHLGVDTSARENLALASMVRREGHRRCLCVDRTRSASMARRSRRRAEQSAPRAHARASSSTVNRLRDYPDITHTVRSQYPVPWWDPAFNFTLGREPINPRPVFYAAVHDRTAPYTDGFISYSDGVNDDLNKAIWTRLAWTPGTDVREIVREYTRFFFGNGIADRAADGLFALEKNWDGPLATNGGVDGTLALWQQLEQEQPSLLPDWRWQMYLLRAYYDAYTRQRAIHENALEREANEALRLAPKQGSRVAIDAAAAVLRKATTNDCCPRLRQRIQDLCESLFQSIRLQTSVPKYHASGAERGAILDFIDFPLNNRWWMEDELEKIRKLSDEPARLAQLERLRTWEDPGPGSFYDSVGHLGRSPRVVRVEVTSDDPFVRGGPTPHFSWEQEGKSRKRLSWQSSLRWPLAIVYERLDPQASYTLRLNGVGDAKPRIDGEIVQPKGYGRTLGELKEYDVPATALSDGRLVVTFDAIDERHLNWRQHSRLSEAWLIKKP